MADLNISLTYKVRIEDKVAPIKSATCLRLVVFFPFRCCLAGSLQFSSSTEKYTKLFYSNFRDVFHFFSRTTLREKSFSLNVCKALARRGRWKLQAHIKGGNFGVKLTHLWGFRLEVWFFSLVKTNIVRDSDGFWFFTYGKISFAPLIG